MHDLEMYMEDNVASLSLWLRFKVTREVQKGFEKFWSKENERVHKIKKAEFLNKGLMERKF